MYKEYRKIKSVIRCTNPKRWCAMQWLKNKNSKEKQHIATEEKVKDVIVENLLKI